MSNSSNDTREIIIIFQSLEKYLPYAILNMIGAIGGVICNIILIYF